LTCSEAFIVHVFGDAFHGALEHADVLFCNASEAAAVTKTQSAADAFAILKGMVPACVVTDGPHGAYVRHGGHDLHVPAFPCEPKDLTGAGDMFAGAFLYGITHGVPADKSARAACYLSMKVITQLGARLHHGTRQFWEQAVTV
jgi:sugar/nucleoside kinase (ribokinase family)